MILNLFADSPDPESLKTQINASLMELVGGLGNALVGEVHEFRPVAGGDVTIAHNLGVKPLTVLFMSSTTIAKVANVSRAVRDGWTKSSVTFPSVGGSSNTMWALIIGKLGD